MRLSRSSALVPMLAIFEMLFDLILDLLFEDLDAKDEVIKAQESADAAELAALWAKADAKTVDIKTVEELDKRLEELTND